MFGWLAHIMLMIFEEARYFMCRLTCFWGGPCPPGPPCPGNAPCAAQVEGFGRAPLPLVWPYLSRRFLGRICPMFGIYVLFLKVSMEAFEEHGAIGLSFA